MKKLMIISFALAPLMSAVAVAEYERSRRSTANPARQ
jgi:hypothetical protein